MSQVFSGDSVNGGSVAVITTSETQAVTGNFLNPPFGNAKAMVSGQVTLTTGTNTTGVTVRIRRNPNAENSPLTFSSPTNFTAGQTVMLNLQVADVIPDGRPVQYTITVQQSGATANGSITGSNISAILISG